MLKFDMNNTKGEGDILFSVRILLVSASVSASASRFLCPVYLIVFVFQQKGHESSSDCKVDLMRRTEQSSPSR